MANWNLEWFGDEGAGPVDEGLQLANARTVLNSGGADIWGLQEIVDAGHFAHLMSGLPQYGAVLVGDPAVANSSSYNWVQKVALLYRQSTVTVQSAQIIPVSAGTFAGRPPLRVDLRVTRDGWTVDLVVIVLHLKANTSDPFDDRNQRQQQSEQLKGYLDSTLPTQRVLVIGDWNDDLDTSISVPYDTPFRNFLDDPLDYMYPTRALTDAGIRSTVSFSQFIDHQMVTNEVWPLYVAGSARSLRPGTSPLPVIPSFGNSTSDHYPTLSQLELRTAAVPVPTGTVFINEILADEPPLPDGGQDFPREFVEIVNGANHPVDLTGWKIYDQNRYTGGLAPRHVFSGGPVLDPGKGIAVMSGASGIPPVGVAVAASSGVLFLDNANESVYLVAPDGGLVDQVSFGSSTEGVSINRNPDLSPQAPFVLHTQVNSALSTSPGTRATGAPF